MKTTSDRSGFSPAPGILRLDSTEGTHDWDPPVIEDITTRTLHITAGSILEKEVDKAIEAIEAFGAPMHLLVSGNDGAVAVRVAVTRPDLVKSLLLADCGAVTPFGDVTADLAMVRAPALVLCASPDGTSGLEASQTLAGQIENGVFVVIHNVDRPAHATRPSSFNAWSSSFISIVEGLSVLE